MYQYESKKPTEYAKSVSFDKGKKVVSSRRNIFNSSFCQHNRKVTGYTIQKSPVITAMASKTENQYSAGSARQHFNEMPSVFPYVSTNRLQVSENRIPEIPPIATAIAPVTDNQCSTGAAGQSDEYLKIIENLLSSGKWRNQIGSNEKEIFQEIIRRSWSDFLCQFLKYNGFKPYGANQSLTYHRPGSNCAAESPDNSDERRKSQIGKLYSGSSGIRKCREYNSNEEIKRYLRHCAAALAINFRIENEIQCYYDDNIVYVATNNDADLNKLSLINDKKISDCAAVLQYSYKEINEHMAKNNNSTIWCNFQTKLDDVIFSNRKDNPDLRRLRYALTCPATLREAKFQVVQNNYGINGLHAERKILCHLRTIQKNNDVFLNPLRLGGIRRPCFICSALCFADMSQVHPGPVWVSGAASTPRDAKEMFLILDAIKNKENVTFISFSEGHLTIDNDSDSDERS